MTNPPETVSRSGAAIGGITATLAMVATYTGAIDYLRAWGASWIHWPNLRAVVLGIGIGVAFTAWVPYVFGKSFCAERAQTWMRLGSSVLTFAVAWRLQQTELGFYYALVAALAGTQAYMSLSRMLYKLVPFLKPPALREPT